MLCDDLEGWNGWGGREDPEGGDMCMLRADSHCYRTEMNTTL